MPSGYKNKSGVAIMEWQYNYLFKLKQQEPGSISIYVIYVDDHPVTSAWLTFNGNSHLQVFWAAVR
ncbi:hypothetical protein ACFPCW_18835 [Vibrio thalassae]|uniref:hypothetical protein n=1 Tax=Vibrio thalassae TaxID=1243014 RepID=UPI0036155648